MSPVGFFRLLLAVAVFAMFCGVPAALGQDADAGHALRPAWWAEKMLDLAAPPLPRDPAIAIAFVTELQKIGNDPAYPINGSYYLSQDIDASDTASWNDAGTGTSLMEGFSPIGGTEPFSGVFDGQGHSITGLVIHRPGADDVGLFAKTAASAVIKNVAVVDGSVTGNSEVGTLLGANYGWVEGCSSTGTVVGSSDFVGGLVGHNYATVSRCYATGSVTSSGNWVGGLAGCTDVLLTLSASESVVAATGSATGVGGLAGRNDAGTVSQCYATGPVYASGSVDVGGLIGLNYPAAFGAGNPVAECYATGRVYATGSSVGGCIGQSATGGVVTSCFWDVQTSGQAASAGGVTGLRTVAMQKRATYVGWDFTNTWIIQEGLGYPVFIFLDLPPSRPTNLLPANAAFHVSLTPLLTASAFEDVNYGDSHLASQWQVCGNGSPIDFSVVLYDTGVTTQSLTSCWMPRGILSLSTYYRFRVRYGDRGGKWSAWSVPTFFRTKDPDRSAEFVVH